MTVTVSEKSITLTVAGQTITHQLTKPMKPIRTLGYAATNTTTAFSLPTDK